MKGQLTKLQDMRQALIENRLGNLGTAIALLEHDRLRVQQAIERDTINPPDDLLGPVLEDIELVKCWIRRAQEHLHDRWEDGQERRWDGP